MGVYTSGHTTTTRTTEGTDVEMGSRALEPLSSSPLVKAGSSVVSKLQKPGMWGDLEPARVAAEESGSGPTGRRTSWLFRLPVSLNKDKYFRSLCRAGVGLG